MKSDLRQTSQDHRKQDIQTSQQYASLLTPRAFLLLLLCFWSLAATKFPGRDPPRKKENEQTENPGRVLESLFLGGG